MKAKTDIFTIIIAIVFLAAAGYFAYDKFLAPYEGDSIETVNVESEFLSEYYLGNGVMAEAPETNQEFLDLMDQSEASHYKIVHEGPSYQLWQIPESEFLTIDSEASIKDAKGKTIDMSREYLMNFFNFSYEKVHESKSQIGYKSYTVEKCFDTSALNIEKKLQSYFNGNIDKFFTNNELVLSCDDLQFTKIGRLKTDNEFDPDNVYFLIGTANVTTVTAAKDISKAWILPAAGKTQTVKIKAIASLSESEMPLTYFVHFEQLSLE